MVNSRQIRLHRQKLTVKRYPNPNYKKSKSAVHKVYLPQFVNKETQHDNYQHLLLSSQKTLPSNRYRLDDDRDNDDDREDDDRQDDDREDDDREDDDREDDDREDDDRQDDRDDDLDDDNRQDDDREDDETRINNKTKKPLLKKKLD
ncbi:uncharacterized protein [Choristoneura fumiferana]|uniref:uncharacterized protein n=1 Tax=Choristoneura fumiferana TaxID=7141 RepID=UPI003D15DAD5